MLMRRTSGSRTHFILIGVLYAIPLIIAGAMVFFGVKGGQQALYVGGGIGLVFVATTAPLAFLLVGLGGRFRDSASLRRAIEEIRDNSMLSDNAKRVLFRDRELHMLHDAIEDDIARCDYNAAITLCDEMAALFGQRTEAEAYRSRIARSRAQQYELEVQAALDQFEASLAEHHWAEVHQQAARIRRLYPDSHLVGEMDQRIERARSRHRNDLERRFLEAAEQDDPTTAMGLLKELDHYLSRDDAQRLAGTAEEVIVRHRDSLSRRFRIAVNEHLWGEAAQLGEAIIVEFPNSKMATEVGSMIEVLRSRATQAAVTPQ